MKIKISEGDEIETWLKAWNLRDLEEKKLLNGDQETLLSNLLHVRSMLGK